MGNNGKDQLDNKLSKEDKKEFKRAILEPVYKQQIEVTRGFITDLNKILEAGDLKETRKEIMTLKEDCIKGVLIYKNQLRQL